MSQLESLLEVLYEGRSRRSPSAASSLRGAPAGRGRRAALGVGLPGALLRAGPVRGPAARRGHGARGPDLRGRPAHERLLPQLHGAFGARKMASTRASRARSPSATCSPAPSISSRWRRSCWTERGKLLRTNPRAGDLLRRAAASTRWMASSGPSCPLALERCAARSSPRSRTARPARRAWSKVCACPWRTASRRCASSSAPCRSGAGPKATPWRRSRSSSASPTRRPGRRFELFQQLFDLTRAEAALAVELAAGRSLDEAAGISASRATPRARTCARSSRRPASDVSPSSCACCCAARRWRQAAARGGFLGLIARAACSSRAPRAARRRARRGPGSPCDKRAARSRAGRSSSRS